MHEWIGTVSKADQRFTVNLKLINDGLVCQNYTKFKTMLDWVLNNSQVWGRSDEYFFL